uniref:RING finger and SPRY domain-containing protein 1 n=3 Tax=Onchocerca TaxID=6281 RepID=A0A8R1Y3I2_ONCVO
MGGCLCKRKRSSAGCRRDRRQHSNINDNGRDACNNAVQQVRNRLAPRTQMVTRASSFQNVSTRAIEDVEADIRDLIWQTLKMIRYLVSNDQEPPTQLLKLNLIADKEGGWIMVVMCLIDVIPVEDPLGPAVIILFLDESPLPTKIGETVTRLLTRHMHLELSHLTSHKNLSSWHRNTCIVLGCLAEKLAGPSCMEICTSTTLNYLLNNLEPTGDPQVILFSLIALEKFAQTSENKLTICRRLEQMEQNPLLVLESWLSDPKIENDWMKQQVAFCAQWTLDNVFVIESRIPSYMTINVDDINAMLNHEDVSEYLKIGPNGLEARCDVSSFESVRCTFEATHGIWFYEALILTPGVMQIGFATKQSRFSNQEGYGIGDDDCSIAYDGCRQLIWHNADCTKIEHDHWKAGDILGCLLNLQDGYVQFYLNGLSLRQPHRAFLDRRNNNSGFFAAASFMSFQHCRFNFGLKPFKFPPVGIMFKSFNDSGTLFSEQKAILPRQRRIELLTQISIADDACTLCYANSIDTVLKPCRHGGICYSCSEQIELCPLCRETITERVKMCKRTSMLIQHNESKSPDTSIDNMSLYNMNLHSL